MLTYMIIENFTIKSDNGEEETLRYLFATFRNQIDASHYLEETLRKTEFDNAVMSKKYTLEELIT